MSGKAPIDAVNTIHKALGDLKPEDQIKALHAAITLLGIAPGSVGLAQQGDVGSSSHAHLPHPAGRATNSDNSASVGSALEYFRRKDPKGLIEALAVAARYRELKEKAETHTKEELEKVFGSARRDAPRNFPRDVNNAKKQRYFNNGKDLVLSDFGQRYVDALPDRDAARAISRPKKPAPKKGRKPKSRSK